MAKVKGSPVYRLKVVPHRPLRSAFISFFIVLCGGTAVVGSYWYAQHTLSQELVSPAEMTDLRTQLDALTTEATDLRRELATYQLSAEVDRKAGEELRKKVVELRAEKAALQRDIDVYRILTSNKNANPKGISFGVFSVVPAQQEGKHQFKLVVQKLAGGEEDFVGSLSAEIVGQRDGKEVGFALHELATNTEPSLAASIPLNFKFFQNIETEIVIPEGFSPTRLDLIVTSNARRNPVKVQSQLEWPEYK